MNSEQVYSVEVKGGRIIRLTNPDNQNQITYGLDQVSSVETSGKELVQISFKDGKTYHVSGEDRVTFWLNKKKKER